MIVRALSRLLILCLLAIPALGCSQGEGRLPSEMEKAALQVFFREEWNKRFVECEDWFYSRSDSPSTVYVGLRTDPSAWSYEWKPATRTEDGRKIVSRCTVFIATRTSTVYTEGSWLRPFKQESGYLVAADIMHAIPGKTTPEQRRDHLEEQCVGYKSCVGFDVIQYADGAWEIVDGAKYWSELRKPENCGEIPR